MPDSRRESFGGTAAKSSKPTAPSIYTQAAQMQMGGGDTTPTSSAGASEKSKNVKVLLEVFEKMRSLETDPQLKDMIQQMADIAKQYQTKLEPGAGAAGKPPVSGEAGGAGAAGAGGGAGAGPGAGMPPMSGMDTGAGTGAAA